MRSITRRRFVDSSVKGAAAIAAGAMFQSRALARPAGSNEKVVLGLIGAGGRGSSVAGGISKVPGVEFKYVCDCDRSRGGPIMAELTKQQGFAPQRVADMRQVLDDKDLNGVVIATPDHWHALAAVWACQAGKDVFVEKSPSLTIWEGRKLIEATKKYNRVVQVGLENRSGPYAFTARDYVQSGKLGKVVHVKVYNMLEGFNWQMGADAPTPEGLDWDRWLGPAPKAPYNPTRHRSWINFWEYKGGAIVDDGIHQLDLTRMVLGDPPHPKSVTCVGGNYAYHSQRPVPEMQTALYDYGDYTLTIESGNSTKYMKKFQQNVRYGTDWPNWATSACRVEIYGTKAMMYLGRHGCGWQVIGNDGHVIEQDKGYFPDKWHQPNFVECVRSRKAPNAAIEQSHMSACVIHMANVAYRVGSRQLFFDAKNESFVDNDAADRLLKPAYRPGYILPNEV